MRKPLLFTLALLASLSVQPASAQQFVASAKNGSTTATSQAKYLKEVLGNMQSRYQTAFIYKTNLVETATVSSSFEMTGKNLEKDLRNALEGNNLAFEKAGQNLFVITAKETRTIVADEVTGRVKDGKTGEALPGVSIVVKGTTRGTTSDANGNYKIAANDKATLVFSFVGYDSKEAAVGGRTVIDLGLEASSSTLSEVQVVGSRSTTARTNIESAAPVDVITPKELKGFSQVDVGQILNYVAPSFNSNRQTVADGTDHIDPASLRGLGPDQVLVLVNGKRRHTSALVNINGTVGRGSVGTDMNVIPVAAIERIEVLRDGAAAQYGSDAIAGVINVVLKKDYKGLTASFTGGTNMTTMKYTAPNINGGTTDHSHHITDGQVIQFDISKGMRLGKKGAMSISAQYNERGKTSRTGLDNAPTIYLGANAGFPATPAGQDVTTFRKTLLAADAAQVTARGYNRENMIFGNSNARNIGLFINGGLPIGIKSEAYFSAGITSRTGQGYGNNRIPVSRGQQPLASDGSLLYKDGFLPGIESTIGDQSLQLGFKTTLGGFKMDLSNTYGANTFKFNVFNSGNATLPNSDTQPTSFDAGKLQFTQNTTNLDFSKLYEKVGSITGLNIAFGAEFRTDLYKITAGELASYSGAAKNVPVAPIVVGGPAYNNGVTAAGPGGQVFPGYQPSNQIDKSRTNLGLYGDLEGEFANRLLVGVAARFENYSDFGSNVTGKLAARLKLTDNFAVRGSASTGFRAPSLHQRYFNNTSTQFVGGVPSNTLTVNNEEGSLSRVAIGVDALKPETSVNFTAGVTAKLGTLSLTIDAYKIDIKDRIVYSGAFSRALLGFTADQYVGINNVNFFANAANTSTQGIDVVANGRYNVGKGKLFVTLAMNFNENKVTSINSTPLINSDAKNDPVGNPNNWFKNLLFDRQQISRIEVWQPKDKINLSLTYSIGKFDITARTVRFGEAKYIHNLYTEAKKPDGTYWNTSNNIAGQPQPLYNYNSDGTAKIDQVFAPVFISDLIVNYKINNMLGIAVGANNVLDVYPDQIYIDPRNAIGSVDYVAGRDASNRGRLLFQPNQGGYNGRFVFARLTASF